MALKITKLDFELGHNEKIPNGLWYIVADYVKRGEDSYDRAKRRFAVTTLVSRLNEIREQKDVDESDIYSSQQAYQPTVHQTVTIGGAVPLLICQL